jgi:hypothetical protein
MQDLHANQSATISGAQQINLLLIDGEGMGLDFAYRCGEAGHKVRWYRMSDKPVRDGDGFPSIEFVNDWKPSMNWAKSGVIVTTGNHRLMRELDRYREFDFPIFAPSHASAQLEINRKQGMDFLEKHGLEMAPYKMFSSLEDAIDHIVKTDTAYCFKTMGDEEDKSLTYVGCTPEDLIAWLEKKIEEGMKPKGQVMLQEKIDPISEVGVAAWLGPNGFLPHWELSWEHKKLMSGNYGPNTGEMATVVKQVDTDPLAEILQRLERDLIKLKHIGDFAINGGVDARGRYLPYEVTARLGWPDFFLRCALNRGDPLQWMRDLWEGKDTLKTSHDVGICVLMVQPPFPPPEEVDAEHYIGNRVDGLKEVWSDVHPVGLMIEDGPAISEGKLIRADTMKTTSPYVLVATGLGKTVAAAREKVYGTIAEIKLANAMVRDDIGEALEQQLPKLHALGYAKDVSYI